MDALEDARDVVNASPLDPKHFEFCTIFIFVEQVTYAGQYKDPSKGRRDSLYLFQVPVCRRISSIF